MPRRRWQDLLQMAWESHDGAEKALTRKDCVAAMAYREQSARRIDELFAYYHEPRAAWRKYLRAWEKRAIQINDQQKRVCGRGFFGRK